MIKFLLSHSKELTMAGALAVLTICYFQQRELTKLRAEVNTLNEEVSNNKIDIGRYEVMWGVLSEEDSVLAEKIEHEVE